MNITKESIEKTLGYEIVDFRIYPKTRPERVFSEIDPYGEENWEDAKLEMYGLDIYVVKKQSAGIIHHNFKITKRGVEW